MIQKNMINGLALCVMLSLIPAQAHAGWFPSGILTSISNYFNQPSKNALIATTALAGISFFTTAWSWWKASKASAAKNALIKQKENELKSAQSELAEKAQLVRIREASLAQAKNQVEQLTDEVSLAWNKAAESSKKAQEELVARDKQAAEQAALLKAAQDHAANLKALYLENLATIEKQKTTIYELENQDAGTVAQDLRKRTEALEMETETLKAQYNKVRHLALPHQRTY